MCKVCRNIAARLFSTTACIPGPDVWFFACLLGTSQLLLAGFVQPRRGNGSFRWAKMMLGWDRQEGPGCSDSLNHTGLVQVELVWFQTQFNPWQKQSSCVRQNIWACWNKWDFGAWNGRNGMGEPCSGHTPKVSLPLSYFNKWKFVGDRKNLALEMPIIL